VKKGFTLVEVVIVLAVVAILAAILVPVIGNNINQAKIARAAGDVKAIGEAIVRFRQDLGYWPLRDAAGNNVQELVSSGTIPSPSAVTTTWQGKTTLLLDAHLVNGIFTQYQRGPSPQGVPCWNGPYLSALKTDPFNQAFLVNVENFYNGTNATVYVLCAGTDKVTDTNFEGGAAGGDDISFQLQ
jgi:prepilin-type N-terminal cleavage/methylation domain-containing protein